MPLAMFATVANAVLWLWTTVGVAVELLFQVIPASLGLVQTIDAGLARTLFSWTLHAIVYFWLIPAYIAFYTMVPRAAGGRLYSDTMGRLTFILFLLYSLPVGMHHLMMDPEHGNGWKFIQVLLTAFVAVPTLLTIFTITASLEIAGRLRGGRGVFGWIAALPWDRPAVLATGLAFVMLGFGGFGGLINMGYGMNAMVHNTSWVTAHFHLIFGGSVVIMYFAIAYEIWPRLTGREHASLAPLRLQLWLWFIGMMVMTLPWHWLGLQGQWRRVANFNYADPIIAAWGPWVIVSFVGGLVLLASALLFVRNLAVLHRSPLPAAAASALRTGGASAAARSGCAQRLRALERAGPCPDAAGLRLPDRPVRDRSVAGRDGPSGALGARHGAPSESEPHVLDRPWRIWASVAVFGIMLSGILLGVLIIPVVQGRSDGIDAYTAICRALGILPGSPARAAGCPTARRRRRFRKWCGRRTCCKFSPTPSRNGVAPKCRRFASPATASRACRRLPEYPHLAGQSGAAIYKQLNDYRTGSRTHQLMTDIAKALDEATLADVAAYYAAQPKRNPNPATLAESPRGDRAPGRTWRSQPQHSALRVVPSPRVGRPDRNTDSCRARAGIHRPAVEDVCLGRAAQRCLWTDADDRGKANAGEIDGLAAYYRAGFK